MNGLVDLFTKLGPARIAAMGAVTLALLGFFGILASRMSQPSMGILYTDLSSEDASAIMKDLDTRGDSLRNA